MIFVISLSYLNYVAQHNIFLRSVCFFHLLNIFWFLIKTNETNKKPLAVSANPEERGSLLLQQEKQNTRTLGRATPTKTMQRPSQEAFHANPHAHRNTLENQALPRSGANSSTDLKAAHCATLGHLTWANASSFLCKFHKTLTGDWL